MTQIISTTDELKPGLSASEVDARLMALVKASRRMDAALCFYLLEVDRRELYRHFAFASTADYARERFGLERRKTQSLLYMARRFESLPDIEARFRNGELAWTKAREIVKVASHETELEWLERADAMSNRQLEAAVREELPAVTQIVLKVKLEGARAEAWVQVKEALEQMAGKTLSDIEAFDIMFAEVLCTYAATPPLGPPEDPDAEDDERPGGPGGYAALVVERDGFQCTRPGCSSRTALTGNHIVSRGRGGPDEPWNLHTVCLACHQALTSGQLTVRGRAPDGLTWESPWGVIETPLPLSEEQVIDKLKALAPPPDALGTMPSPSVEPRRMDGLQMAELLLGANAASICATIT